LVTWLESVLDEAELSESVAADRKALRLATTILASSFFAFAERDAFAGVKLFDRTRRDAENALRWIAVTYRDEPGWRDEWAPR
jgi:hypothetical protein